MMIRKIEEEKKNKKEELLSNYNSMVYEDKNDEIENHLDLQDKNLEEKIKKRKKIKKSLFNNF